MTDAAAAVTRRLVAAASSPYQRVGGFAWRFARGKLAGDPLFITLLRTGAIPDAACLVDLGCGQGLLAAWIRAARDAWQADANDPGWPAAWPAPPKVATYLGIDQSRADIARARPAMPTFARVIRGDLRKLEPSLLARSDVVTLFDVMQYLEPSVQERLVDTMAKVLPPWAVLVMRIGDDAAGAGRWTNLVDWIVCALRGHPRWRLHRRPLAAWRVLLEGHGFVVEVLDDGRGTTAGARPRFANVLLRASRPASGHEVATASVR